MQDTLLLTEALARYKGFLHLIRINQDKSLKRFCVPTYDVDIMWHSHQLCPISYCNDLMSLLGKVLEHDDTDSDRSKGKKLDTGFTETTKQFEDTFGLRYWRAGVMYRGKLPTPLTAIPVSFSGSEKGGISARHNQNFLRLPSTKVVEVLNIWLFAYCLVLIIRVLTIEPKARAFMQISALLMVHLQTYNLTIVIFFAGLLGNC